MRWPRPLALSLLAALGAGCAHGPPPIRATRLVVEPSQLGPRPYVKATVAGKPVRFLLDTGAWQSMLPASFVRAHRLPLRSGSADGTLVDSNGTERKLGVAGNVPLLVDGDADPTTLDFLVNDSGALAYGEGVLSPQELLRPGFAMVIDLEGEALTYEKEPVALGRFQGRGPFEAVDFHACRDEGFFNRYHRVVPARVNGVATELLLDTGANQTALNRNNEAIPSMLASKGSRLSNSGLTSTGHGLIIDKVPVEFAGKAYVQSATVLPASGQCWRGTIGTDLLRHCVVVWGWDDLLVGCRSPRGGSPAADARPAGAGPGQPPP